MSDYHVAWWNVENLFDVENSPRRTEHMQDVIKGELAGWDDSVLNKKISQLSSIIVKMNNGNGPDILGVCEIENSYVMEKLVNGLGSLSRNYKVAHHDCSDERGIDVAFVYDNDKFTFKEQDFHIILKRNATRDLFQVTLETQNRNELILIGNHWPARTGGILKTEPYRIMAGETLAYWNVQLKKKKDENVPVFVMGDFNDEPYNRSLRDYALSTNTTMKVTEARDAPVMFNLMWPLMWKGIGSFYFNNFPSFYDQFLVTKGFLAREHYDPIFSVDFNSVRIEKFDEMIMPKSKYEVPRKFGRPSIKAYDNDGYSDHYPISIKLKEKQQ